MYKKYLNELFTEGLGDIFFMKYYNFLNKKVNNKIIRKILINIHIVAYMIFLMLVSIIMIKLA